METIKNDPKKAGQPANKKRLFGPHFRYAIYAIHTRFDRVCWIVTDAEKMDYIVNLHAIIRQEDTKEKALGGLK